jgi:hypothetical protein
MEGEPQPWWIRKSLDALAGIQIGIIGGLVMLLWFALSSSIIGQSWWTVPNLFASHSYGLKVLRIGPGAITIAGIAMHLMLAGTAGAVAGILTPGGRIFGLGFALVWYIISATFLWKRVAPLLPVYASHPILMISYFIYGSVLGWHPHLAAKLQRAPSRERSTV